MNNFFLIFIFAWLGAISFFLFRLSRIFSKMEKVTKEKDFKEAIQKLLQLAEKGEKEDLELKKALEGLKAEGEKHFQKIGFIRYNPFSDTGGNQSFVLAILDGNDTGFVITSLHGRDSTRIFAKPVQKGKPAGFEFSQEEVQAIQEAQKKGRKTN